MIPNPKVDFYFTKAEKWQKEFERLRTIMLSCGLTEELKWGVPCYTFQKGNIVLIHGFKEYCAVLFFKGVLLQDAERMLFAQTDNTQSTRQVRFTSIQEIVSAEPTLKAYLFEAIDVEKTGLKVELIKSSALVFPDEFQQKLDESAALKTAFDALTPGRQRAYYLHFSAPKQAKTRESRVEKCIPQILNGKGFNE